MDEGTRVKQNLHGIKSCCRGCERRPWRSPRDVEKSNWVTLHGVPRQISEMESALQSMKIPPPTLRGVELGASGFMLSRV